jgi:hypothetical protein
MPKKYSIEFFEAKKPILELVTKFGGQPNWVGKPEWPLSKSTHEPMRFIGQIALDAELVGAVTAKMAYLYMTDDSAVDGTWEPDGGENALIIQPGQNDVKTEPLTEGPTLFRMEKRFFGAANLPKSLEYGVRLIPGEDPEWLNEEARFQLPEEKFVAYNESLVGNKLGGTPGFLQGDEFPEGENWKLVLQLDSAKTPFWVNFGDAGVGYAFISKDCTRGKFVWQCV